MSLTHVITRAYRDTSGTSITATETVTGNSEGNYDAQVAGTTTNQELDLALIRDDLESLSFYSDQAVSFKVNGNGAVGSIVSMVKNAGGTGYALSDTGTISGGTGGTYLVTGVSGAGAVTAFTFVGGSAGYAKTTGAATATGGGQPGSGTGFTVNITQIVETFSLVLGQNLIWSLNTDTLAKLAFTCDVTKFFVTNAGSTAANIKIRSLSNV